MLHCTKHFQNFTETLSIKSTDIILTVYRRAGSLPEECLSLVLIRACPSNRKQSQEKEGSLIARTKTRSGVQPFRPSSFVLFKIQIQAIHLYQLSKANRERKFCVLNA
ncbi:hypothetical protein AVEN_205452-1 [Araneus ventricosus]|uniref:Uncharacterized protein n=1 Tax=Araneus ventricosus TaxID=182803 RepID=A0A4Y2CEN5_ARAVE|nr:hypothetical protein AVEN_205452-1 [Araneus ventricosus]